MFDHAYGSYMVTAASPSFSLQYCTILKTWTLVHVSVHPRILSEFHSVLNNTQNEQHLFSSSLKSFYLCRNTRTRLTSWCLWVAGAGSVVRSPTEETLMTPWESECTIGLLVSYLAVFQSHCLHLHTECWLALQCNESASHFFVFRLSHLQVLSNADRHSRHAGGENSICCVSCSSVYDHASNTDWCVF